MATKIKQVKSVKVKLPKPGKLPKAPQMKKTGGIKHPSAIHLKMPKA